MGEMMISTLSFGLEELGGGGEGHSYETVLQRGNLSDLTKATLLGSGGTDVQRQND